MATPADRQSSLPRLKVCLASLAPFVGGAEIAIERLALGLIELGHEPFMLLGESGPVLERMQQAGLRCIVRPMAFTDKWHFLRYIRSRNALRQVLREEKPALVHSNDLPTHQVMSGAAQGLGIPRISHHRFPMESVEWYTKFGCERHLFVSKALMDEMCTGCSSLAASPRAVVYDGLPFPELPTPGSRVAARRRLDIPSDRVVVMFTGQIIERKGVADLLHAWKRLPDSDAQQAVLYIVGDDIKGQGAYRTEMERLANELNVPARFMGFQKNVGDWLLASDFAVVPSHVEPLGNATLEAMAYALPVVGCSVGGIPEMVVHDQTGLLVPPHSPGNLVNALSRLIQSAELRRSLGDQGRRRCEEKFSLRAHTAAVLREYEQVL